MNEREARLGSGVEPGPLTPDERTEFLLRPLVARLGLVRPDGYPFIVPLWFHWEDDAFWLVVRERARFIPALLTNPRVCLSIAAETPPYARVTALGEVEVVDRPGASDRWLEMARKMARRYVGAVDPGYVQRTADLPRWLLRVAPREMVSWRGGGWHRRYLP